VNVCEVTPEFHGFGWIGLATGGAMTEEVKAPFGLIGVGDHCQRSFRLAMLIASAQDADIDIEVVYVGIMLHDLGQTTRYNSPTVRFEVAGANAARAFVRHSSSAGLGTRPRSRSLSR